MSVTFWMPQAPQTRVQPEPVDDPDWWTTEPAAPFTEVNLANANAAAIARLIDPVACREDGVYGEWGGEKLAAVQRNIMRALNTNKRKQAYLDPFVSTGEGQCRVFEGGRDEEYVTRTLTRLAELVRVAQEHGFPVSFS